MALPKPRLTFPVTGSTFEGRQAHMIRACTMFDLKKELSNYNGGLQLVPEPDNQYDKFAVKVLAATEYDSNANLTNMQQVGYVPKRWCPKCGEFMMVRDRGKDMCTNCGAHNTGPDSILNQYIVENFAQKSIPIATFVTWVGRGMIVGNSSFGMRIGLWWP